MGRNQRTISYNLTHASSRAAFEDGLDLNEFDLSDELGRSARGGTQGQQQRLLQERNRRGNLAPAFQAEALASRQEDDNEPDFSDAEEVQMVNLVEIFCSQHSPKMIRDVFETCGRSFDAALQILSDMESTLEDAAADGTGCDDDGVGSSQWRTGPGDTAGQDPSLPGGGGGGGGGPSPGVSWWDLLHESEREAVLSHLSARDLARVAWTCRDFAWRVRNGRINARSLVIPTGVTLSGILGMVAGHPNARAISLVRWGASQLRDADFNALISAIAQGSCSSRRTVRVEAVSLRGWSSASDSNLLTLLDTMQHLRELDLSDCSGITDACLGPISRYQRTVPEPSPTPFLPDTRPAELGRSPGHAWGIASTSLGAAGTGAGASWSAMAAATGGHSRRASGSTSVSASVSAVSTSLAKLGVARGAQGQASGVARDDAWGEGQGEEWAGGVGADGAGGGVPGGSSDEESLAGGSEDEDDTGVAGAGGAAAGAQAGNDGTPIAGGAGSSSHRSGGPAWGGAGTTPPSGALRPPLGGSSLPRNLAAAAFPPLGTSPPGASAPGSLHRHGHAALLSSSPAPPPGTGHVRGGSGAGGAGTPPWANGAVAGMSGVSGPSPPFGTSPPGGGTSGSLGRGGSFGSLGKSLFGRFGGVRGSTPPQAGRSPAWDALGGTPGQAGGGNLGQGSSGTAVSQQRGLEVLCLAGCSRLSPEGVRTLLTAPLVKQCLKAVDLSRCMRLTRAALVLPPTSSLRVLKAAGCQNLHEVVMQLPLNSPLQELWLNNCKQLSRLHVVAPRLTLMHIGGCKSLTSLQLRCPKLTQLLANLCFRLCDVDVEDVSAPALEELNLFGCRQLGAAGLTALTAGCPNLALLNLNGCNTLQEVVMQDQLQLRTLDVSGCRALTTLRCASPLLTHLTAKACHHLASLFLESTSLQSVDLTNCLGLRVVALPALPPTVSALQVQQNVTDVLSSVGRRGAAPHSAQARVVADAAGAARMALAVAGIQVPLVRAVGCDSLAPITLLVFKVFKAMAALPAPPTRALAPPEAAAAGAAAQPAVAAGVAGAGAGVVAAQPAVAAGAAGATAGVSAAQQATAIGVAGTLALDTPAEAASAVAGASGTLAVVAAAAPLDAAAGAVDQPAAAAGMTATSAAGLAAQQRAAAAAAAAATSSSAGAADS